MGKRLIGKLAIVGACMGLFASGTYAGAIGTVLYDYHTNRGDVAVAEMVEVHTNRIALRVDGESVWEYTLYVPELGATFVPLRGAITDMGGTVEYDSRTQTANIVTNGCMR